MLPTILWHTVLRIPLLRTEHELTQLFSILCPYYDAGHLTEPLTEELIWIFNIFLPLIKKSSFAKYLDIFKYF